MEDPQADLQTPNLEKYEYATIKTSKMKEEFNIIYPGKTVFERAKNALAANPNHVGFQALLNFITNYSMSYVTKKGNRYTGRFGIDGVVKASVLGNLAHHVVR